MNIRDILWAKKRGKKSIDFEGDTCVIFDPKSILVEEFYDEGRHDTIINGFDDRCVRNWAFSHEIDYSNDLRATAQAAAIAASMFPMPPPGSASNELFFIQESRGIAAHIFKYYKPADQEITGRLLAYIMNRARPELDRRVFGSKYEQDLNPGATPQRNAIISTFTQQMDSLEAIPDVDPKLPPWSIREWGKKRRGYIWFTQQPTTEVILRPWQNMMIDLIIRTVMDMGIRKDLPKIWFHLEESAQLGRMENMPVLCTKGREYGMCPVVSIQAVDQFNGLYGEAATRAMMAAMTGKLFLKAGEDTAARYAAQQMGMQRISERSSTFTSNENGKTSTAITYRERDRPAFVDSTFRKLPDRQGYFQYLDFVVKCELPIVNKRYVAPGFIQREAPPVQAKTPAPIEVIDALFKMHGWGASTVEKDDKGNAVVTVTTAQKGAVQKGREDERKTKRSKNPASNIAQISKYKTKKSVKEAETDEKRTTIVDDSDNKQPSRWRGGGGRTNKQGAYDPGGYNTPTDDEPEEE